MKVGIGMLCWIKHIIPVWYPKLENCAPAPEESSEGDRRTQRQQRRSWRRWRQPTANGGAKLGEDKNKEEGAEERGKKEVEG